MQLGAHFGYDQVISCGDRRLGNAGLRALMQLGAHLGDDQVISFGDLAKLGFKSAIARGLPATNPAQRA